MLYWRIRDDALAECAYETNRTDRWIFQGGIDEVARVLCTEKLISSPAQPLSRSVAFQHIYGKLDAFASMETVASQDKFSDALLTHTGFYHFESSRIRLDILQA